MGRFIILSSLIGLCLTGCTKTTQQANEAVEWATPHGDLGKTVLLIHVENVGSEDKREERTADIYRITAETFATLEATEILDESALTGAINDQPWLHLSDYETIMASRAAGLDSICELTVREYAGWVRIGFLPLPGWDVASSVNYRLRVLDVHSGRIIVDTERRRETRRPYAFGLPSPIESEFANDLRAAVIAPAQRDGQEELQ